MECAVAIIMANVFYTEISLWYVILSAGHICACMHNNYMTLIGVHELDGQMYPNQDHVTNLFAVDPF